jgi:hypothetical protein
MVHLVYFVDEQREMRKMQETLLALFKVFTEEMGSGLAIQQSCLSGLFGPIGIGSPWSSFHTPPGAAHFTPYTTLQGKPRTLSLPQ